MEEPDMNISWRKSSFSDPTQCVELAELDDGSIGMRDSKLDDESPVLSLARSQVADLVAGIKAGEYDDLG